MAKTERPKARQSQLVTTYGVGSLFPAGDQSFVVCGIDEWQEQWCEPIEEPRLAASLGVTGFRAPSTGRSNGDVPVVRFPEYHYCPECRRLDPFWRFDQERMRCDDCDREITPSRFVACCENGHLEDFPYFQWIHRGTDTAPGVGHRLRLESRGASSSLADIVIHCSCGVRPVDLDGSFSRFALRDVKRCSGNRPWLPGAPDEQCDKSLRVLQRGSSNVWFSAVRSTISIPPWSSPDARFVARNWDAIDAMGPAGLPEFIANVVAKNPELSAQGLTDAISTRRGLRTDTQPTDADLRRDEYRALVDGNRGVPSDTFRCEEVEVDDSISDLVAQVSIVSRLREVRALHGFTRVTASPTETTSPRLAKLSERPRGWLPATEVLGEGVFLRLSERALRHWEQTAEATSRVADIQNALEQRAREFGGEIVAPPTPRFLALHSLAHALMEELSLDAGYPVGAIRERVYASDDQAGILVYTASSDAAGSLGGLAALGAPTFLARAFNSAISRSRWCSNDPVCAESGPSGSDGLNLAACHACLLVPETSCESRNVFLDRVSLVGTPDSPGGLAAELGY